MHLVFWGFVELLSTADFIIVLMNRSFLTGFLKMDSCDLCHYRMVLYVV